MEILQEENTSLKANQSAVFATLLEAQRHAERLREESARRERKQLPGAFLLHAHDVAIHVLLLVAPEALLQLVQPHHSDLLSHQKHPERLQEAEEELGADRAQAD